MYYALIKYAILAPSSHNSQPWFFKVGEDYIELYADIKRKLKESDREGRMLFVSLGCVVTNLKVAADYFGMNYEIEYDPEKFPLVARMTFSQGRNKKPVSQKTVELFQAITRRCSNRNRYKNLPIPFASIEEFKNFNQEPDLKIDFISDMTLKHRLAEISSWAMGKVMSDASFRKELANWLRNNLTRKKDGMPGNGHGMSLIISLIAPFILKYIDVSKVEARKEKERVLNFPTVGIISSRSNNPKSWLKTGELLEKILLAAETRGISGIVRVASIEVPEARQRLTDALNLQDFQPQMFLGLGYATKKAPRSPRRGLDEVIKPKA